MRRLPRLGGGGGGRGAPAPVAVLPHKQGVLYSAWSPDGRFITSLSHDDYARFWEVPSAAASWAAAPAHRVHHDNQTGRWSE